MSNKNPNILIRLFAHRNDRRGLGDAVQFNIVLRHIKKFNPDWNLFGETTVGKDTCHTHLMNKVFIVEEGGFKGEFDRIIDLKFDEPNNETSHYCLEYNVPATKPTHTLIKDFGLLPDKSLFYYDIKINESTKRIARKFIDAMPKNKGIVIIHYEAASSPRNKNMEVNDVKKLCDCLLTNGYTPLIFDWHGKSPLPDDKRIFRTDKNHPIWEGKGTGDASMIAALIENARLFIGVDSGPLHLAACTKTPSIGYWKLHHPVHFFDLSTNVTHLVPGDARRFIKAVNRHAVENYFNENYKHFYYHNDRGDAVIDAVCRELGVERDGPTGPNADNSRYFPFVPVQSNEWWPLQV